MNSYHVCMPFFDIHLKVSKLDLSQTEKGAKNTVLTRMQMNAKVKIPIVVCANVLQLAKSPLWYSPYKRRTKSEIQPNSHGLTGHAKSHNDEDLWLTKNNPLRLVIIHSKRNLVIHII